MASAIASSCHAAAAALLGRGANAAKSAACAATPGGPADDVHAVPHPRAPLFPGGGEGDDVEDGSDADVPIESALEVLDSDFVPETLSVIRRERRTDEELVQDFWAEIGYPTPASRFWEKEASPNSGNSNELFDACRDKEEVAVPFCAKDAESPSPPIIVGAQLPGEKVPRPPSGFHVQRRPRAVSWRGPCPPRRITPLPVLGQFMLKAGWASDGEVSSTARPLARSGAEAPLREPLRSGGARLHASFSWACLGEALRFLWVDHRRHAFAGSSSSSIPSADTPRRSSSAAAAATPPDRPRQVVFAKVAIVLTVSDSVVRSAAAAVCCGGFTEQWVQSSVGRP
ncbi:hypothetical protein QYE76_019337 [Lolium multiflorum]|uniref:Uncharacterized protein n=1 Tax=Lolium multiflorum TaxID=4521 RepID=A0AAD8VQX4_LOLMU|nr:hypothetical protein QYE76_019337 [Lolium multiflorum]